MIDPSRLAGLAARIREEAEAGSDYVTGLVQRHAERGEWRTAVFQRARRAGRRCQQLDIGRGVGQAAADRKIEALVKELERQVRR